MLKIIVKDKLSNTHEIVKMLKNCDGENWQLIPSVIKVIKLLLVMGGTITTAERSFSTINENMASIIH